MKTTTLTFLLCGTLVLAGVLSDARPALGQNEGACPRPPGVEPPPEPHATAQQVENGSIELRDFALAARDEFQMSGASTRSVDAATYFGCLVRQDGGHWYEGSTYIVNLDLFGRVFFHAKDMSLGGRQLRPEVYKAIRTALGFIPPAPVTNPDGGEFTVPPVGTEDTHGYAALYNSANFGPTIMLVGLDLDESHLIRETVDSAPAIAAEDVVDRRTLKAFVNAAADFVVELSQTGNLEASSKIRIAFRDENGPWRHGAVYLFMMAPNGYTIFHGAFPDRFELQTPTTTLRDAVTGELILPQIIATAMASPGGGFVEYHFDNPDDDNDSAEIPKVTYAEARNYSFPGPDGTQLPVTTIIGAGIYGDPVSDESTVAASDWMAGFGRAVTSVAFRKYVDEDAPDFLLSARRDDEQWRVPREEEQRSRRQKGQADSSTYLRNATLARRWA